MEQIDRYKEEFIEFMIDCDVLKFGDFITKSGRKTPFFINTGSFKTGSQLKKLGEYYAKAIKENFGTDFEVLFGPAYKGIPLSVSACISMSDMYGADIKYCSNRKEIKDHGDKGILLGGPVNDKDRVVIIEDVTTAGTSVEETMPILNAQGSVNVLGLIVSVDRCEKGRGEESALKEISKKYNIKTASIVSMREVINYLYNKPCNARIMIDDKLKGLIDDYYKIYGTEN